MDATSTICFTKNTIKTYINNRTYNDDKLETCSTKDTTIETYDNMDNNYDKKTNKNTNSLPYNQKNPTYPYGKQTKCITNTKTCEPFTPTKKMYDLLNNDYDKNTNEDFPNIGTTCNKPNEDLYKDNILTCSPNQLNTICTKKNNGPNTKEIYNKKDNNCDKNMNENLLNTYSSYNNIPIEIYNNKNNNYNNNVNKKLLNTYSTYNDTPIKIYNNKDNNYDKKTNKKLLNTYNTYNDIPIKICDNKDNNYDNNIDENLLNIYDTYNNVPIKIYNNIDNNYDNLIDKKNVYTPPQKTILILNDLSNTVRQTFDQKQT